MDIFEQYSAERDDLGATSKHSAAPIASLADLDAAKQEIYKEWTADKLLFAYKNDCLDESLDKLLVKPPEFIAQKMREAKAKIDRYAPLEPLDEGPTLAEILDLLGKQVGLLQAQQVHEASTPASAVVLPQPATPPTTPNEVGGESDGKRTRTRKEASGVIGKAIKKAILRLEEGRLRVDLISRQRLGEFLQDKLKGDVPDINDMEPKSLCATYLSRDRASGFQFEPEGTPTGRKDAEYNNRADEELARAWREGARSETLPLRHLLASGH